MRTTSFKPTAEDLLAANRLFYFSSLRSARALRAFALGGIVFAILAAAWAWDENFTQPLLAGVAGFLFWTLLLSIILLGNFLQLPRRVRRIYAQQKGLHDLVEVTWTDAQFTLKTCRGVGTFDWSDFIRARRNGHVLILLQSDVLFNFVPARALTSEQAADLWKCCTAAHATN